jgi:exosortase A
MLSLWWRSATFTYGFLIAPGALFLAWQRRAVLQRYAARPAWSVSLPILAAGLLWLTGSLADIQAARQLAAVSLLIFSCWLIIGHRLSWALSWPLGFLLFMVPEGEFLIPVLMDWTADFTAAAARATGIPVFREGMQLTIPSGSFEIIEACSGVRFLLASLALGCFMAGAVFSSWLSRLLVIATAIVVPLLANGLRAYGIVLLGHLSEMRLVADHVLIGQVFFSAIFFILCLLAIRYSDLDSLTEMPGPKAASQHAVAPKPAVLFSSAAVAILLCCAGPLLEPTALERIGARNAGPTAALPVLNRSSEKLATNNTADWRPLYRGASEETYQRYGSVDVFLVTYTTQSEGAELVNARNSIYDREQWRRVNEQRNRQHRASGLRYNQLEIRAQGRQRLLRYWFLLDGEVLPRPEAAKLEAVRQLFATTTPSSSLVAAGLEFEGSLQSAEAALDTFLTEFCQSAVSQGHLRPCGK